MAGVPANPLAATSTRLAPPPGKPHASIKAIGIDGLRSLKAKAPNAASMSDTEFALAAHEHAYSDVPLVDFLGAVGLDRGDVLYETRQPGSVYGDYARKALAQPGGNETPDQTAKRHGGALDVRRAGPLEGTGRALLQGATFGAGDEIVAAGAALLDPLVNGDRGKDLGQRFNAYMGREQGLVQDFREDNPALAYGAEIAGAIPTAIVASGPAAAVRAGGFGRAVIGGADAALQGAGYGFMGTDGSMSERGAGAAVGAGLGVGGSFLGSAASKVIGGMRNSAATKAATQQVIAAAPSAATIKAGSKAAFKAAEGSGAIVSQQSLGGLVGRVRQLATNEGLLLPSGAITDGYTKAAGALRMIEEYAKGNISMKQAQALLKTVRGVAKTGGSEGEFGRLLVKEVMDHFDGLRASDFVTAPASKAGALRTGADGPQAIENWRKGMSEWARAKRVDSVEKIIHKAQFAKGGFAEGLRSGFRKVLMNERRQTGFSKDELAAIEKFVKGGPIDDFMSFIQRGSALPAAIGGHIAGGPLVGAALGGARMGAGAGAGALRNRGAREVASELRAGAALGRMSAPPPLPPRPFMPRALPAAGLAAGQTQREPVEILVKGGRR